MPEVDPNRLITVGSGPRRVTVTPSGFTITSAHLACTLRGASYPSVQYIPRNDMQMNLLEHTRHHTHCPYKGDTSYYTTVAGNARVDSAVWTYKQPKPVAHEVAGHLAFYPNRVTIQEE